MKKYGLPSRIRCDHRSFIYDVTEGEKTLKSKHVTESIRNIARGVGIN